MKSRPILFSAPMVRAILDGKKTQTRRIVKPQPVTNGPWTKWVKGGVSISDQVIGNEPFEKRFPQIIACFKGQDLDKLCPYGVPGDQLWVRETFAHTHIGDGSGLYVFPVADPRTDYGGPWKPSIHMPRTASRITLEITNVRVERLNQISEDDAKAEGVDGIHQMFGHPPTYRHDYRLLWESINGPGSWMLNPWVWVIEFKWVQP